jgi:hypothetical protein
MKFTKKHYIVLYLIGILLTGISAWLMFKPAEYFDMMVIVKDAATQQVVHQGGSLSLDLGSEKRRVTINAQGEAHFIGIPTAQIGNHVGVMLDVAGYTLPKASSQLRLGKELATLNIAVITVRLSGQVIDTQQQPVANAQIDLAQSHTQTDENGWFVLDVPSTLLNNGQRLHVTALGFKPYQITAISDDRPQTLILQH